jgi:hypothetical protein
MEEWEYVSVVIAMKDRGSGHKVWFVVENPELESMNVVLNHYGKQGYELVHVSPEYWTADETGWFYIKQNRLFFKRRKMAAT